MTRGLTDWELRNLHRHRGEQICCGKSAWVFLLPQRTFAPEVLANFQRIPAELPLYVDPAWEETFIRLCRASTVLITPVEAWEERILGTALTLYGWAIERADAPTVRQAITEAHEARFGKPGPCSPPTKTSLTS